MPQNQFIILPPRGLRFAANETASLRDFLASFPRADGFSGAMKFKLAAAPKAAIQVLDTVAEDGAKLVEMSPEAASALTAQQPGLRIVPITYFQPAVAPRPTVLGEPFSRTTAKVAIQVVSSSAGQPVAGADVLAFTDFENRIGAQGRTDAQGRVSLALGSAKKVERVYIYPRLGFWSTLRKNLTLKNGLTLKLTPIDLRYNDALRHFYGNGSNRGGRAGMRIGVVDMGVGPHQDLLVSGGENTVLGEAAADIGDNGQGHGTHVAGIIGASGKPPQGVGGLAPSVALYSFRVFGQGSSNATNFAVAKAIDRAVLQGCDLINLSLSGIDADPATASAIADARAHGSLVLAAAGSDDRMAVACPAAAGAALAVSALGRVGTFPPRSTQAEEVAAPRSDSDPKNFIAAFSNVGVEIGLTAPGVGIISTVPGGYAVMDGTSMACPAATGAAARLLSTMPSILEMPRGPERADAMATAVLQSAEALGFGPTLEGRGLL